MSYFKNAFLLALRRRLRSKGTWFFGLLALVLTIFVLFGGSGSKDAAVQVGLVLPEEGGEAFAGLLDSRSSQLVTFRRVSGEELDKHIISGDFDCGLILHADFDRRLEELDTDGILTVKIGPASTVYPLVQETAAACMMELMSPHMAKTYLESNSMSAQELSQRLEALAASAQRVQVQLEIQGGEQMDPLNLVNAGSRRILRGLTAVLALIWALYLTVDLGRWLESSQARRLRTVLPAAVLLLPQLTAALLPMVLWGLIMILVLGGGTAGLVAFLGFGLVLLGLCMVVSQISILWQAVPVLMPFLAAACLLLEPVLLDVSGLFPRLSRWTAWLPVTCYIHGCEGSVPAILILLAEGLALLGISLLLEKRKLLLVKPR